MVQKYNKRTRVSKVRVYRTANIWPYSFFHRNICEKHAPIRVPPRRRGAWRFWRKFCFKINGLASIGPESLNYLFKINGLQAAALKNIF